MKHLLLLAALIAVLPCVVMAAPPPSTVGNAVIKDGILTITKDAYKLSFSKKSSWTIREMYFNDKLLLSPTGAFGSVASLKGSGWHGTGHGRETVEKAALDVDGKSYDVVEGLNANGDSFVLFKQSVIGPYRQFATISFDGKRIVEDFQYEVISDDSNVSFMYVFMHCFTNKTDQWIAQIEDGSIAEGKFLDDNSFTLEKNIRWAAVYDSAESMGLVYVYPQIYKGKAPFNNSFWNRPRDNKLYLRPELPAGIGQKFRFKVTLQAFDASTENWQETAKSFIADIK